jgi:hypothetical protein
MSADPSTPILTLTNTQAKELAGRLVTIGAETYYFKDFDRDRPGQPPWRSGAEGKAYPLLGRDRTVAAYLKFFTRPTRKRLDRTAWLIAQRIHAWLPGLAAAPIAWGDTRLASRAAEGEFDFAGCLSRAVPGKTWLELKTAINENSVRFSEDARWRCVCDLLASLAVLEQAGIVHGDLSPNNVVIDLEARTGEPMLHLIDFDAFVADAAGPNRAVALAEGGTYGTDGYCPPDLAAAAIDGDGSVAPRSDRYGRDMLLLELLLMDCGLSPDDPPSIWSRDQLDRRLAAWRGRGDRERFAALSHLDPEALFALADEDRPSSAGLAEGLGLPLPARPRGTCAAGRRHAGRVPSSTPMVLGHRLSPAHVAELTRRWGPARQGPAMLHHFVPWRWGRPEADPFYRTIWQDLKAVLIFMLPFLVILIIGILRAIFGW